MRIEELLRVGSENTIRYLSVEPQWERIDLRSYLPYLGWIVQGGESGGALAKKFDITWAGEMRQHYADAHVPYFLKQLGCYAFSGEERIQLKDTHGGDWTEWPDEAPKIRQMPVCVENGQLHRFRQRMVDTALQPA